MPTPRRSSTLRGSKAAPGPSPRSRERAANQGAFQAGKNYTARGVDRTGYKPTPKPTPSATARPKPARGLEAVDTFRQRGYGALGTGRTRR